MSIIRFILGRIILFLNWVFTPRGIKRDPAMQTRIDGQTARLKLYQYEACPFCVKVRRAMKRQQATKAFAVHCELGGACGGNDLAQTVGLDST